MPDGTRRKSKILKTAAAAILLFVAVLIAIPFIVDADQFRPELQSRISAALGRDVKLGEIKLSLLSGSLSIKSISIGDDPEFSRSPFLTAESLQLAVEMRPLIFSKSVRISGINLGHPSITLIRSKSGKWNISGLGNKETAATAPEAASGSVSGKSISIGQLRIAEGQVTLIHNGTARKPSIYNNVNLSASDISYASAFPFKLTASLPGTGTLRLEGRAGPLHEKDMIMTPSSAEVLVKGFDLVSSGFILPESALAGVIDFSGALESRAGKMQSSGEASIEKLQVVKGGSPAGKPVTIKYAIAYDLQSQEGTLKNASIGHGAAVAHLVGTYAMKEGSLGVRLMLEGKSMPIEDLTALLPAMGIVLPRGASLQGGTLDTKLDAQGPLEKLVTEGNVEITGTRLSGFDLSGKMAVIASLAGLRSRQETEIEKFAANLRFAPEGIQVSNLSMIAPALGRLTGDGRIAADQSLEFAMQAAVKPGGTLGAGLSQLVRGGEMNVPFFVRGTTSNPKFVPDMGKAAGGLLGSVLGRGKKSEQSGKEDVLGNTLRNLFKKK